MVKSRSFGEIVFILHSKNGARKLESKSEFNFLAHVFNNIKSTLPFIIVRSIQIHNYSPILAFLKIMLKKAFKQDTRIEREHIFSMLEGDIELVEIKMLGQSRKMKCPPTAFEFLWQVFIENQYDVSEENIKNKVIVDVGSNIGDFSILASFFQPKKVYAFEPLSKNFQILCYNVTINNLTDLIVPVQLALGSEEAEVLVDSDIDVVIDRKSAPSNQKEKIKITTIDNYFKGNPIGFIKMDVEGYEENVLLGATNIIRKYKPVLSFSAYHKPTDKVRLPQLVKNIRADYRIKLNSFYEEDFYCD